MRAPNVELIGFDAGVQSCGHSVQFRHHRFMPHCMITSATPFLIPALQTRSLLHQSVESALELTVHCLIVRELPCSWSVSACALGLRPGRVVP